MQKLIHTTFIFFWLSLTVSAQEISQIKAWQQQHPNVVFVSNESYQQMSPEDRAIIENKEVIFFTGEISLDDIYSHEGSSYEKGNDYIGDELEYLKKWVSKNTDVKIIKNSAFQNASPSLQSEYAECIYCMILTGEEISIPDIERFEQEKH